MKPSLPWPPFVSLVCAVGVLHIHLASQAFAAAYDPHAAAPPKAASASPGRLGPARSAAIVGTANARAPAEVEALIAQAGATPPDWWPTVEVKYPPTLDLTWANPGKQWDAQKNLGQYIWDIINPNPSRWREGVRLLHHVLAINKDHPEKVEKTVEALARMYQNLLQDWARAAFWWRKTIQLGGYDESDFATDLGECYWRLGNRDLCVALISKLDTDDTRHGSLIKLWADLGGFDKALKLAEAKAASGEPDSAYLAAGDACRLRGRYAQALDYYRKVVAVPDGPRDIKRNKERAAANLEAIRVFDDLNLARIPDGTYQSSSIAYNGPLHVAVAVKNARITSVKVTKHTEKQFYSAITDTTTRILEKQGVKGVDMTSGATITAEAIVNATAKALASGMK
jgi:uncharacterized protein with FMN-binding domain